MKKSIFYFFFSLMAASALCQSKKILGACSIDALKQEPFATWYVPGLNEYKPHPEILSQLKKVNVGKFTFKVFFGSWCGDSKRELPRMSKILNELSIPEKNIQWIAVDDSVTFYKQSPQREEKGLNIFVCLHSSCMRKIRRWVGSLNFQWKHWSAIYLTFLSIGLMKAIIEVFP